MAPLFFSKLVPQVFPSPVMTAMLHVKYLAPSLKIEEIMQQNTEN